jgi:hypothetical protein
MEPMPPRLAALPLRLARRAHFFAGRLLGADDFAREQDYARSRIEVDEGGGFEPWLRVDDLAGAGLDDRVYALDRETGAIRFGDGVHGRRPAPGARVRAAYRLPADGEDD